MNKQLYKTGKGHLFSSLNLYLYYYIIVSISDIFRYVEAPTLNVTSVRYQIEISSITYVQFKINSLL